MDSTTLADNYSAFNLINNEEDAKHFVVEKILKPMLDSPLFETQEFDYSQSKCIEGLYAEHERALRKDGIVWLILTGLQAQTKFDRRASLLRSVISEPNLWQRIWIDHRYDLKITSSVLDEHAKKEHASRADGKPLTEEGLALIHWWKVRETYRWERVDRQTGEITSKSTGLCFLVDKSTNQEAPLLPGNKPYTPPSQQ